MPLGTKVVLGPHDIVLDGDPAPPSPKRGRKGWIKPPLGTEVDLDPDHFVLDGFPAIGERGTTAPPLRPMPIVATVAHLSYC